MSKYHTYVLAGTKRLGRFRKRLTVKSDWAITAALNLLWEKSNDRSLLVSKSRKTKEPNTEAASLGSLCDGTLPPGQGYFFFRLT